MAQSNPIVIVGMGGGGLAAAIRLVQKGQQVVIFESRDEFTRPQRIFLDGQSEQFINSLIDPHDPLDVKFKQDKFASDESIRVRSLQKFLYRKLVKLQEENPHLLTIHRGEKFKITGIDPYNQILTYTEEGQVKAQPFSHFLEADGARHAMADLLNETLGSPVFNFELQEVQHRHPPCGVIQCQLHLPENISSNPKMHEVIRKLTNISWHISDIEGLLKQGWDKPYYPRMFIYADLKQMKFGFATELPDSLYTLSQDKNKQKEYREQYLEWARFLFTKHIESYIRSPEASEEEQKLLQQLKPEDLSILSKKAKLGRSEAYLNHFDRLNATAFKLEYYCADTPSVELGQGGVYALVGDSFQTPWFYGAHGMNDAMGGGIFFAESFDQLGQFDTDKFDAQMEQRKTFEWQTLAGEVEKGETTNTRFLNSVMDFYQEAQSVFEYVVLKDMLTEEKAQVVYDLMTQLGTYDHAHASLAKILQLNNHIEKIVAELAGCKESLRSSANSRIVHAFETQRNPILAKLEQLEAFAKTEFPTRLKYLLQNNFPIPQTPTPQSSLKH